MAKERLGVAVLPECIRPETDEARYHVGFVVDERLSRHIAIIRRKGCALSSTAARVADRGGELMGGTVVQSIAPA